MQFDPTRTAALDRLRAFLPNAGRAYANSRNFDDGVPEKGARGNVSQLSPWLHAGIISEAEVIEAVLGKHSPSASEKFVAEVFWRVYFKGYLEQRPSIWRAYCEHRDAAMAELEDNAGLRTAYNEAIAGRTGIAAFDHWARELVETGYLHNHARMWFASIWIFTLKLDWTLGADFFLQHLLDGDAASNTLSWRWVGGLHTKGKTYLARADNIARYTANRKGGPLAAQGLAQDAPPLEEAQDHGRRPLDLPQRPDEGALEQPFALLLHDEAASHVPLNLPTAPAMVIGAACPASRSPQGAADKVSQFAIDAVAAGVADAAQHFGCKARTWGEGVDLNALMADAGVTRIAVPYLPQGWTRVTLMPQLETPLQNGEAFFLIDDLNRATWPYAKAGFFGVKKVIDRILGELGVTGRQLELL